MPSSRELPQSSANRLLTALSSKDYRRLRAHLESISFSLGHVLFRSKDVGRYLYFPETAVVSLITMMQQGENVEVGLVGREGIAGIQPALGAKTYGHDAVVQFPGVCMRIKTSALQSELKWDGVFLEGLHGYLRYLLLQVSQTGACNRVHKLQQRLARWLLMTRERVGKDTFPATHEFLSNMLGADRSDVTLAAGLLRRAGLLTYNRGIITIVDRKGLESAACECYGAVRDDASQRR